MINRKCAFYGTMTLTPCKEDENWRNIEWCFIYERELKNNCIESCSYRPRRAERIKIKL